jgi:hypothetical protein
MGGVEGRLGVVDAHHVSAALSCPALMLRVSVRVTTASSGSPLYDVDYKLDKAALFNPAQLTSPIVLWGDTT